MKRYSFEAFSLDPESFRLLRGDEQIHLQPQVFDLVRYLVENRGRLVTREELVREVWQGRYVSDAALSRAISDARRALGDDPRDPRFIRTVHGRGYRFLADVSPDREEAGEAPPAAPPGPGRRAVALPAALALAVLLLAVLLLVVTRSGRTPDGTPPVGARPRLAVLSSSSEGSPSRLLGLAVADLLVSRLQSTRKLDVVAPERSAALLGDARSLAEFSAEAATEWAVELVIERAGGERYVVATTLFHFQETGGVERFRFATHELRLAGDEPGLDSLLAAREAIVRDLVREILPAVDLAPNEGLTPTDPGGYRLYLVARDRLRAGDCRDAVVASELLGLAHERDPDFAPAWETSCVARHSAAVLCGWSRSRAEAAQRACNRALELAPSLASAATAKAIVLTETGQAEEAYELITRQRERTGDDPLLAQIDALVLRYAGFLHLAERTIERLVERNPGWFVVHPDRPNALLYLGRHDRYLELLPRLETPRYRFHRGWTEWRRGARDAAFAALEPAFRGDPGDQFARLSQALLALIESRPGEARIILEQVARERRQRGAVDGETTYELAELLALADSRDAALQQLGLAVEQGFFCSLCMARSPAFGTLRGAARFREALDLAHRRHLAFAERFGLTPEPVPGLRAGTGTSTSG